jgi:hypothetical protein
LPATPPSPPIPAPLVELELLALDVAPVGCEESPVQDAVASAAANMVTIE